MSLCTLPAPVSSNVLTLSPAINVALFSTDTHLLLCRRSGQQIWSTRLPHTDGKAERVSSISWSPDGMLFAAVFSKGLCIIYDVNSGRPVPSQQTKTNTNVASVSWRAAQVDTTVSETYVSSVFTPFISASNGNSTVQSLAAVGMLDGKLRVNLYGALDFDEFLVHSDSSEKVSMVVANETNNEFAAVQGTKLYVYKSSANGRDRPDDSVTKTIKNSESVIGLSADPANFAIHTGAVAMLHADELQSCCTKIHKMLQGMREANQLFIAPFASQIGHNSGQGDSENVEAKEVEEALRKALLATVIHGVSEQPLRVWMETQHEQGFKKWYKAMSQNWESLYQLIAKDTLEILTKLTIVWGQLGSTDTEAIEEMHQLIYSMLSQLVPQREVFENQAAYVEHLFREEIDRPIGVTKITSVTLSEVGQMFLDGGVLGEIRTSYGDESMKIARKIREKLNEAVSRLRSQLHDQLELLYEIQLGSGVSQMKRLSEPTGNFALILDSDELVVINCEGSVVRKTKAHGTSPVFLDETDNTESILSLDKTQRLLLLPNNEKRKLDFMPVAVAVRKDIHNYVACVLSEDCQHYQFIDI